MDLSGKRVLVTGGAKRVGSAIARAFAEKGAQVLLHCNRSRKEADALAAELAGGRKAAKAQKPAVFVADLTRKAQVDRMVRAIAKAWGGVDVLVNNASLFYPTTLEKISEKDWDAYWAIHVKTPFFLARAFAPYMKKRGGGRVINLCEWMSQHPTLGNIAYGVTKMALLNLTETLAKALAPEVLVTAVCPGPVLAPPDFSPSQKRKIEEKTLVKRWGRPEDVADMAVFLAESDFTTGSAHIVDGGYRMRT